MLPRRAKFDPNIGLVIQKPGHASQSQISCQPDLTPQALQMLVQILKVKSEIVTKAILDQMNHSVFLEVCSGVVFSTMGGGWGR